MNRRKSFGIATAAILSVLAFAAAPASAQTTITRSAIGSGGGTSSGGVYSIKCAIGQPDAAPPMTGGTYSITGGFCSGSGTPPCPADFDQSGALQVADIFAFLNAWFAGDPAANFDGVDGLRIADIFAFLNAWFAGCS